MGLKDGSNSFQYVNVKQGELVIKENNEVKKYKHLEGCIRKVEFAIEEFEGKKDEKAKIYVQEDKFYILQMRTDSGYFRGFANSLKSSKNPKGFLEISPSYKRQDGKNPQTTIFIKQDGQTLKHYFTKDFNGNADDVYPQLEKKEIRGQVVYDNYNQIQYWKNWLSQTFNSVANVSEEVAPPIDFTIPDDLPF